MAGIAVVATLETEWCEMGHQPVPGGELARLPDPSRLRDVPLETE